MAQGSHARADGGLAGDRSPGEAELVEKLVTEESKHEVAPESHFGFAVRGKVPGEEQLADTALAEGQEGKELLDELRNANWGSGVKSAGLAAAAMEVIRDGTTNPG